MGQNVSRQCTQRLPSRNSPSPPPEAPGPQFRLGDLPPELVIVVSEMMSPAQAAALSLTCKDLYSLLINRTKRRMTPEDRGVLLLLEERRVADRAYYCYACKRLHKFASCMWRPLPDNVWRDGINNNGNRELPCTHLHETCTDIVITYPHARLVMNRHFFGGLSGLPLSSLEDEVESQSGMVDTPEWKSTSSARIINNELFVKVVHELHWDGEPGVLMAFVDKRQHLICNHLQTHREPMLRSFPYRRRVWRFNSRSMMRSGWNAPMMACSGGCKCCLTDYTVKFKYQLPYFTMSPQPSPPSSASCSWSDSSASAIWPPPTKPRWPIMMPGRWSITVTAWHQLGDCQSPQDWKFRQFTDRLVRDTKAHPHGAVRRRWKKGAQ